MKNETTLAADRRSDTEYCDRLFRSILERELQASGAEEGGILVRNERTLQLRVEDSFGPGVREKRVVIDSDPSRSVCAQCASTQKPIYVPDVTRSDITS